jgi:hypothetical protein
MRSHRQKRHCYGCHLLEGAQPSAATNQWARYLQGDAPSSPATPSPFFSPSLIGERTMRQPIKCTCTHSAYCSYCYILTPPSATRKAVGGRKPIHAHSCKAELLGYGVGMASPTGISQKNKIKAVKGAREATGQVSTMARRVRHQEASIREHNSSGAKPQRIVTSVMR